MKEHRDFCVDLLTDDNPIRILVVRLWPVLQFLIVITVVLGVLLCINLLLLKKHLFEQVWDYIERNSWD